jgi:hypothetical protein
MLTLDQLRSIIPPAAPVEAKTPGQVAAEAFVQSRYPDAPCSWDLMNESELEAWEAAASAVLAMPQPAKVLPTEEEVRAAGCLLSELPSGKWVVFDPPTDKFIRSDGIWTGSLEDPATDFPTREAALAAWGRRRER